MKGIVIPGVCCENCWNLDTCSYHGEMNNSPYTSFCSDYQRNPNIKESMFFFEAINILMNEVGE